MMPRPLLFLLFIIFLGAALLASLPLRVVSAATGIGADAAVFGTVWNGRVQGFAAGPRRISDIAVAMRPAGLLTGRAAFDWTVTDPAVNGSGRAATGLGGSSLSDARLVLTPAAFITLPGGLLSPQDAASVTIGRLDWYGDTCTQASGRVRSDALYALGQRLGAELPALDGVLACEAGVPVLRLSGEAADAAVSAELRLLPTGISGVARAETGSSEVAAVLEASGFALRDGVWTLTWPGGPADDG